VAALAIGSLLLTEALLTDYSLGPKKVIPFAIHGRFDAVFAAASLAIPRAMGFEGNAAAVVFKVNSAVEGTGVGMTDYDSDRARRELAA
jgi:hypothetical protein